MALVDPKLLSKSKVGTEVVFKYLQIRVETFNENQVRLGGRHVIPPLGVGLSDTRRNFGQPKSLPLTR